MKGWKIAGAALLLLMALSGCEQADELAEPPVEEEQVESEAASAAEERASSASRTSEENEKLEDMETRLASIEGLPEGFSPGNRGHILEYFAYLLENGLGQPLDGERLYDYGYDSPVVVVGALQHLYLTAPHLLEVEVRVLETESLGQEGGYRMRVDVVDGGSHYRDGEQDWYVQIGYPPYGETITVIRMIDLEKAEAMLAILEEYPEDVTRMLDMRRIAFIDTFDSPVGLDPDDRTGYMIVNVPPSGEFGESHMTYITQEDMDEWSERLFGVRPHSDPESRFYDSVSYQGGPEQVYSMYYGWGPPVIDPTFVYRVEDGDGVHYYFEEFLTDSQTKSFPTRLLRYTMRDGMVWSCVDVSGATPPSFYLAELKARIEGE